MSDLLNRIFDSYIAAVIIIIIGLIIIKYINAYPQKKDEPYPYDIKYWASGIALVIIGLSLIIMKLLGK